ncbi:MAG: hypothetical protein R3B81_12310 [bacterium]
MGFTEETEIRGERVWFLDLLVILLAIALIFFLLTTMGVRAREAARINDCQERMLALSAAQQQYLVRHGEFARELSELRPFLDDSHREMSFDCPITGLKFGMAVQGDRYLIIAPGTGQALERDEGDFKVETGDPNW